MEVEFIHFKSRNSIDNLRKLDIWAVRHRPSWLCELKNQQLKEAHSDRGLIPLSGNGWLVLPAVAFEIYLNREL